jgi:hypothetical protein
LPSFLVWCCTYKRPFISITVLSTSIRRYFASILCSLSGTELLQFSRTMGMAYWLLFNWRGYFSFSNQLLYKLNWCQLVYSLFCTCPQRSLRQFSAVLCGLGENGYRGTSLHWGYFASSLEPWIPEGHP